jgi:lysozyme family protein
VTGPSPFLTWWAFCQRPENDGGGLHNTPGDSGGWTAWGITLAVYQRNAETFDMAPGLDGLRTMTQAEAGILAKPLYWDRILGDLMPGPAAVLWADFAWTSGGATKCLQRMLGVDADGAVGPRTVAALEAAYDVDPVKMLKRITAARVSYDISLRDPEFLHGWERRAYDCLVVASAMDGPQTIG